MRHDAETLTARFKRSFCFGGALAFLTAMTTAARCGRRRNIFTSSTLPPK